MERMTWKRSLDGYEDVGLQDGVTVGDAVCRLSDYEDTGLEPEEIKALIQPPNVPLTLKELAELEGQPVWLQSGELKRYDVFECFSIYGLAQFYKAALPSEQYGKTWTVYRRKPEEEALKNA